MHRIDTPTAQKDKFGAGKNGFTRGNPQTGTPATDLDDDYFDSIQEEIAGLVEAGGLTLDKADRGQVLKALKILFSASSDSLGALAALTGADNKLPYFTGQKGAALADLTAFAREILAQTNAAGVLSKLGLGAAAKLGVATNADMQTGTATDLLPTVAAVISLFSKRTFAQNDSIRIPDVPGGLMIQFGLLTGVSGANVVTSTLTFLELFPNACLAVVPVAISSTSSGGMCGVQLKTTTRSSADIFIYERDSGAIGAHNVQYIAIGW